MSDNKLAVCIGSTYPLVCIIIGALGMTNTMNPHTALTVIVALSTGLYGIALIFALCSVTLMCCVGCRIMDSESQVRPT